MNCKHNPKSLFSYINESRIVSYNIGPLKTPDGIATSTDDDMANTMAITLLLLLLLKKVGCARLRESDIYPISPKTPTPQYQRIDRKKRKGKIVEDYSRDKAA